MGIGVPRSRKHKQNRITHTHTNTHTHIDEVDGVGRAEIPGAAERLSGQERGDEGRCGSLEEQNLTIGGWHRKEEPVYPGEKGEGQPR